MNTTIIGCKTLQDELETALQITGLSYPIIWIESGLHNTPDKLRARLQETFSEITDSERVLVAMGFCGNSVQNLKAGNFEVIIPRVDDCITLLLGSVQRREEIARQKGTYFLSKGWLNGEQNIWAEYQYAQKKYGVRRTKSLYREILKHYKRLGILDTGCYPIEKLMEETKEIAATLELEQEKLGASLDYLVQLLKGPWPAGRFLTVAPNAIIEYRDLWLK